MDSKLAILKTFHYHDLFDFPLTFDEICSYIISPLPIAIDDIKKTLAELQGHEITYIFPYYCLSGREYIVSLRKKRGKISETKFKIALSTARLLAVVPTVRLIGISGSLARGNAEASADIDFFVITAKNTLWITRLCLLVLLQLRGRRRVRNGKKTADRVCLNMFIDDQTLAFDSDRQDVFTAFELAQLNVIWQQGNMQQKLFWQNQWIRKYVANNSFSAIHEYTNRSSRIFLSLILQLFEAPVRIWQMKNSKKHQTTETVTNTFVAFHPDDYRKKVLYAFTLREKSMKKTLLWDIDKRNSIIYTRKDNTISPNSTTQGGILL